MADRNIGDFTGKSNNDADQLITKEDVQYFIEGMKSGLFLDQSKIDFEISNIDKKHPFQGPDFYEVLKLHSLLKDSNEVSADQDLITDGDNLDDYEFSISTDIEETLVHFSQKGASVDTYEKQIVVTFPRAKVSNFFHEHDNASVLVDKIVGYAKVYKIADTIDYTDYELLLPPVFGNKDADTVPHDINFGSESVAMYGDYIAVSAYYSRPIDEGEHQPKTAKVFLYERVAQSDTADPGYKFMSVIEDPDFACEPVLEIHDETLFVSDYVGNFIKTYNITDLKTIENYSKPTPISTIKPKAQYTVAGDLLYNSEWGRSVVCRDGKNLFVGAPNAIVKHSLPVATGAVEQFVLDSHIDDAPNENGLEATPWAFAQSITGSSEDLPWWARYSEWENTLCGMQALIAIRASEAADADASSITASGIEAQCYVGGKYDTDDNIPMEAKGYWFCNINVNEDEEGNKIWNQGQFETWWSSLSPEEQAEYGYYSAVDRAEEYGEIFNEDLELYYTEGNPGTGPVPIDREVYMYVTTEFRFGETIDAQPQGKYKGSDNIPDTSKSYLVVGAPRYFEDFNKAEQEVKSRTGAAFILDVAYDVNPDTSRVNSGTSTLIKRIKPSTQAPEQPIRAMETETLSVKDEQNFFDCDEVSFHIQTETFSQTEIVNRGWPEFWLSSQDKNKPFQDENVKHLWKEVPGETLLHADNAISSKGFMIFGKTPETNWISENTDLYAQGATLGYIKLDHNPMYSFNDDDITIEFWWRPTSTTSATTTPKTEYPILAYLDDTNWTSQFVPNLTESWTLTYNTESNTLIFKYKDNAPLESDSEGLPTNAWYHIALVHSKHLGVSTETNSKGRNFQLYVNGNPQFSPEPVTEDAVFDKKITDTDNEGKYTHNLFIGGVKADSEHGEYTWSLQDQHFDDIRITHGIRYKKVITGTGETLQETGFTAPTSAFQICYYPKGYGADVAMDTDYDVFVLSNLQDGFIDKHTNTRWQYSKTDTLTPIDWKWTDKVTLGKENPVVGGEISIYDTDLVYGNINDLRIFPRNEDITISDGNTEHRVSGGEAFQYTLAPHADSGDPYIYTVELRGFGTINWPDGTSQVYDSKNSYTKFSRTFNSLGPDAHVTITGLTGFGESSGSDEGEAKIIGVGDTIPRTLTEFRNSFKGCTSFNPDNITKWNTRYVKSMSGMFSGATSFDRDISQWNTESLQNASFMFTGATSFNANLTNWFTGNIKNMASMFQGATTFNQPIDVWDVRNVENMDNMFNGASAFNQDLSMWCSKVISNDPENFSTSTSLEASNLPNWNNDCRHGFVEFTFDVSEIEGEFTAVIPFARYQLYGPFYGAPTRLKEYIDRNNDYNFASRTYAGEYDWYVDWGHASGNIRDTEETYAGGIINEKWSVPGTLFGLTLAYLEGINFNSQYNQNHFGRDWNNTKDHVLYHIYPDVTELSEIKVTVHTSDINYSDEYFDGFEYHGKAKDTPESWFSVHKDYATSETYRKQENENASSLYNLIYNIQYDQNTTFGGSIFCKNLKKVMVNNVQLQHILIGHDVRNDKEYDYDDYYYWNYWGRDRGNELKELDIRGLKWFRESWSTNQLSVQNFDTIKLDWPIENPIRFDSISLNGVNQDYPNFPLYDTITESINFGEWIDINFELIKPQYDHFINRIQPKYQNRLYLNFYNVNTISDPLTSIRVKFDNKEAYDLSYTDKQLLEIQEGNVFIKNNYVSDDLSPINDLSTFNNENTNISYSDLENKLIQYSEDDGYYVDIEVRENGKYYGDIDLTDSLKSNLTYNFIFTSFNVNQLLINDINVSVVRFDNCDIKNQDDVCKKIHSGNTGLQMYRCFDGNKFTGILDISHWELYYWETYTSNNLMYAFRNCSAEKIILHPKFDLMVSSVRYFRYCWSNTLNIPNIRNWKINSDIGHLDFRNLFYNTKKFNQDLSTKIVERHGITYTAWDMSGGGNFSSMFYGTDKFNQDLTSWDVSNVNNFNNMFANSNFNGDISNWNISNANDLSYMFNGNSKFNQDISTKIITGTNAETNPSYIAWDTQNATNLRSIFDGYSGYIERNLDNLSIENWNLDKVRDIGGLFQYNKGNSEGSTIDLRTKIVILDNSNETGDEALKIRKVYIAWNTNTVTTAYNTFYYAKTPNIQIDNWNVSNVQNLSNFLRVANFNPDITKKSVNLLGFSDGYNSDNEETKTDQDKILEQLTDEEKQQLKGDDTSNPLTEYTAWYTLSVNNMNNFADFNNSFDRDLSDWCLKSLTDYPNQSDNTNNWRGKLNLDNLGKDCTE